MSDYHRQNTFFRLFRGTHSSLIAVFSLFELLHNFQNLIDASNCIKSENWAIGWYESQLKTLANGDLFFRPEIKKNIKKWYMSDKTWDKILKKAKIEYLTLLNQENIINIIEKLIEKAHNYL